MVKARLECFLCDTKHLSYDFWQVSVYLDWADWFFSTILLYNLFLPESLVWEVIIYNQIIALTHLISVNSDIGLGISMMSVYDGATFYYLYILLSHDFGT